MNRNYKTRKQKIELLKNISEGKRSVADLFPRQVIFWMVSGEQYTNDKTGQVFTKEQYLDYRENHKGISHWVEFKTYGNEE